MTMLRRRPRTLVGFVVIGTIAATTATLLLLVAPPTPIRAQHFHSRIKSQIDAHKDAAAHYEKRRAASQKSKEKEEAPEEEEGEDNDDDEYEEL